MTDDEGLENEIDGGRSFEGSALSTTLVADVAYKPPTFVAATESVAGAIEAMNRHNVGYVLVGTADHVEGIFTERDVLRKCIPGGFDPQRPVTEFMSRMVAFIRRSDLLATAVREMAIGGFRRLPVVDGGVVVGVLSVRAILRFFAEHHQTEVLNAPPIGYRPGKDTDHG
jgi:CBS domain-containing protein